MDAVPSQKECISCAYFYEKADAHKIDISRCFNCARANLSGGDYLPEWEPWNPTNGMEEPTKEDLLEVIADQQKEIHRLRAERDSAEELVEKFVRVYTKPLAKVCPEVIDLPDDPIASLGIPS